MEKKRKKMPVKSRFRVLYRVCALVCALTVVLAVPMTANAESSEVTFPVDSGMGYLILYGNESQILAEDYYSVGDDFIGTIPFTDLFKFHLRLPIVSFLTEEQKYLLSSSVDTTIFVKPYIDLQYDPSFYTSTYFSGHIYSGLLDGSGKDVQYIYNYEGEPDGSIFTAHFGDFFYNNSIQSLDVYTVSNYYGPYSKLVDFQYTISGLYILIKTVGADKSTADIVINLGEIQNSINQGFDQMGDKLDGVQGSINQGFDQIGDQIGGVQDDINSGFDEVGGKLDNIQSDINTGLDNVTGAINGSGADTSGMDNGMAQLGGQLGNLGDVEDQLGGLIMDKVEVPDLILTNDQGSALGLLVSCLNLAYVDLRDYQVMFAAVLFFGIVGVLLFGRRNL